MPEVLLLRPLVMLGDMLVAAMLLLPRFCSPANPLNELLDVDNDPEREAVKQNDIKDIYRFHL